MSKPFDYSNHPHRRRNPLTDEWVLVSPHRNQRPWQGQTEPASQPEGVDYDANCYLCPGNPRMSGELNPDYDATFVFPNDFPALASDTPAHKSTDPLFTSHSERGACRVIAYSPNHSKTLAELTHSELVAVIAQWAAQSADLGARYSWVQIFENKGETMGCSMPHPHGQVWAQTNPPTLLHKEDNYQRQYLQQQGQSLLLDYALREQRDGTRVVAQSADWVALVPYWAAWPFETLLLPTFPVQRISELDQPQRSSLADVLHRLLTMYDNLFECAFPYSMGWHGAPFQTGSSTTNHWQLHAHFYPPLLRSKSVRKFMVGYEMLAEPQRDLTPEQAAAILRNLPATHYKESAKPSR